MKFFPADWRMRTDPLSALARAAHADLICFAWMFGPPPDDDVVLAKAARLTIDEWKTVRDELIRWGLWRIVSETWRCEYVEQQRGAATERREQTRNAGDTRKNRGRTTAKSKNETNNVTNNVADAVTSSVTETETDLQVSVSTSVSSQPQKEAAEASTTSVLGSDATDAVLREFADWLSGLWVSIYGVPNKRHRDDAETLRKLAATYDLAGANLRFRVEHILRKKLKSDGTPPRSIAYVATSLANGGAQLADGGAQ